MRPCPHSSAIEARRYGFRLLPPAHEEVGKLQSLVEPTHSERFVATLDQRYPTWRAARKELNELPLAAEVWKE